MTIGRMIQRRDTYANWAANNPVLADGELVLDTTNNFLICGDGVNAYNSIALSRYFVPYSFIVGTVLPIYQQWLVPTATKTANYTAGPTELVICDVTGGTFAVTLPSAPVNGAMVGIKNNVAGTLTVNRGGSDVFNVAGGATSQTLTMQNQVQVFEYSSGVWYLVNHAIPLGQMDNRWMQTTTFDAKGDLLLGTADNTFARQAAGSNGQVLIADSSQTNGVKYTNIPWCPEMVCTSKAVVDGYNDMPGGISVEPGINAAGVTLDAIWLRVGDLATSNSGGDLICDIYGGTKSTQGTLIASITLTNGSQDVVSTLGATYALAANAVVRAYFTKGSSTVSKPLHVQLRGRYVG